jgi:hypothetical protein
MFLRCIGEKFAANPVTSTGSMTLSFAASPGRSGLDPQLAPSYDSRSGNRPFGRSLPLPSSTRKRHKGLPKYGDAEDSTVFILSDAEDLVPSFRKTKDGRGTVEDGRYTVFEDPRIISAEGSYKTYRSLKSAILRPDIYSPARFLPIDLRSISCRRQRL